MATVNWNKTTWCPINNNFRLLWSSTKTSKEKGLSIFSEKQYLFMDFYFLLACMFILNHFNKDISELKFWFPTLRDINPQSVAPKITSYLVDLLPGSTKARDWPHKVISLHENVSSGSIRVSGVNWLSLQ